MKIAGHSVRTSSKYIYRNIYGVSFIFEPATYVDKSKAYNLIRKAVAGKVTLDPSKRSVVVNEDGSFSQYEL